MKFFRKFFVFLLIFTTISYLKINEINGFKTDPVENGENSIENSSNNAYHMEAKCQQGDFYIIANILSYYAAYATQYLDKNYDEDSPLNIAAFRTSVVKKGRFTFFWKKPTLIIQMIISNEELDFLGNCFSRINIEEVFSELTGANGCTMSVETAEFTENFKEVLKDILSQKKQKREIFVNLIGTPIYREIFQDSKISFNAKHSPICELINVKDEEEFLNLLVEKSCIVKFLTAVRKEYEVNLSKEVKDMKYLKIYQIFLLGDFYLLKDFYHNTLTEVGFPNHDSEDYSSGDGEALNLLASLINLLKG